MRRRTNWLTRARRPKCGRSELMPGPIMQPLQKRSSSSRVSMMPVSASLIACANSAGPSPTMTCPVTRSSWMPATCSMPPLIGKQAAPARVGRVEVAGRDRVEVDAARRQHLAQFGEGERFVDLAVQVGRDRLALLGDARPDEHDADGVAVDAPAAAGPWQSSARRSGASEPVRSGMVAAHVADHRRAGGGDPELVACPRPPAAGTDWPPARRRRPPRAPRRTPCARSAPTTCV